jgi:putative integral membrane protein (TIGR02587 family)
MSPWKAELHHFVHGIAGAFLFGAPFLYTMEVWWRGETGSAGRLLVALWGTFGAIVLLERAAEARYGRHLPWTRTLTRSAQSLAYGLVAAAIGLVTIGVLRFDSGVPADLGLVVMEGIPFGLGVGLADFLLGEKSGETGGASQKRATPARRAARRRLVLRRVGASALGAIVISATLAPTQEVPLIAVGLTPPWLVVLAGVSVAVSYLIVFAANFVVVDDENPSGVAHPVLETAMAYAVALGVSGVLLWLFQTTTLEDPASLWATHVVVLGMPASIGGAAGRLAL